MVQISNMPRHEIMESMFANPVMLDDLDFLYKSDNARKVLFFHQVHPKQCSVKKELHLLTMSHYLLIPAQRSCREGGGESSSHRKETF